MMLKFLAGLIPGPGWLVSAALTIGEAALGYAKKRSDAAVQKLEIETGLKVAEVKAQADEFASLQKTLQVAAGEGTKRQKAKFNFKVFWGLITVALGPGIANMWLLFFYNWLWWEHGVWPQDWAIAAYPPQAEIWVDMSIRWLFDPVGLGTTLAGGGVLGYATRRR